MKKDNKVLIKNFQLHAKPIRKFIPKILALVLMIFQAAMLLQMMSGIVDLRRERFSLRLAIDLFMRMFNSLNNFFLSALAIFGVVMMCLMFKNIIFSIRHLGKSLSQDLQEAADAVVYLFDYSGSSFAYCTLFFVIANYFNGVRYGGTASLFFISGIIVILLAKCALTYLESTDEYKAIFELLYNGIIAFGLLMLLMVLSRMKFASMFTAARLWMNGQVSSVGQMYKDNFGLLIFNEILPLFYPILQFYAMKAWFDFLVLTDYRDYYLKKNANALIEISIALIAVVAVALSYEAESLALSTFKGIKTYFPILFASLAVWLAFYFPRVESVSNPATVTEENSSDDED